MAVAVQKHGGAQAQKHCARSIRQGKGGKENERKERMSREKESKRRRETERGEGASDRELRSIHEGKTSKMNKFLIRMITFRMKTLTSGLILLHV